MSEKISPPLQNATLCQIGFVARDAGRVAQKLAEITGLPAPEPVITDGFEKARTEYRGNPTQATAKLYFFNLGQVSLEIIEPVGGPSTWREFLDKHGDGVHHIAFTVKSTKETADALSTHGIPPVQSGVFEGGSYVYCEAEKELGVILELLDSTSG
ncbi:MAG: VOC family protein [Anaerolineales bacterium]|nr:VOC family protein [Anaerolineales bacterium]